MKKVGDIARDIKSLKIQGAENVAKAGLKAYELKPTQKTISLLIKQRPTEPALTNALKYAQKKSVKEALQHFKNTKPIIYKLAAKKVRKVNFTHCHSSTVTKSFIEAKKTKNFEVFNTETRPLFQGRKTSKELVKAKIKTTQITDSEILIALTPNKFMKKTNAIFLGADAILKDGSVINKVGSGMISELAKHLHIPVYIVTDSWKYSNKPVKIEERSYKEVWKKAPKNLKIKNLAFEKIPAENITAIISELGILKPKKFVKKVKKTYPWI